MIDNSSESVLPPGANLPRKSPWLAGALAVAAVILVGLNLRMGIASASPLFHDLQVTKALVQGQVEMACPGTWTITGLVPDFVRDRLVERLRGSTS